MVVAIAVLLVCGAAITWAITAQTAARTAAWKHAEAFVVAVHRGQSIDTVARTAKANGLWVYDFDLPKSGLYRSDEWMTGLGIASSWNVVVRYGANGRVVRVGRPRAYVTDSM